MKGIPAASVASSFGSVREGQNERMAVPAFVSRSQAKAQRASSAPR